METENSFQRCIEAKISEAQALPQAAGMQRSVYRANRLDGSIHFGCNYQPSGTRVGDLFDYDHGVGIRKNDDAEVVWLEDWPFGAG